MSHQSPLWYLISAGNLFQIRRLQFPFHCRHQTTTGIGENVAKNLNRILSISQIAFLARRNLNWKRTFIYISNKRNATPAQYINTTFVPTGLTSKNYFFQREKFLSLLWLSPFPSLEGGRWWGVWLESIKAASTEHRLDQPTRARLSLGCKKSGDFSNKGEVVSGMSKHWSLYLPSSNLQSQGYFWGEACPYRGKSMPEWWKTEHLPARAGLCWGYRCMYLYKGIELYLQEQGYIWDIMKWSWYNNGWQWASSIPTLILTSAGAEAVWDASIFLYVIKICNFMCRYENFQLVSFLNKTHLAI